MLNYSKWKKIEKLILNNLFFDDDLKSAGVIISLRPMPLEIKGMAFYLEEKYVLYMNDLLSDYEKQMAALTALVELSVSDGNVIVHMGGAS